MTDSDNKPRNIYGINDAYARDLVALSKAVRAAAGSEEMLRFAKSMYEQHKALQAAILPISEYAVSGLLALTKSKEIASLNRFIKNYDAQFRLPQSKELHRLFSEYNEHKNLYGLTFQNVHGGYAADIRKAMSSMHQPWLDAQNIEQSFKAFGNLQYIGQAIRTLPPYDQSLVEQLRASLGDWQSKIDFKQYSLIDPLVRSDLYRARGLDSTLTSFPAEAFLESTTIAGLRTRARPAENDSVDIEVDQDGDEEARFTRTNAAHNRLMRFEVHVRNFIEKHMLTAIGEKWIKQRVPGPMMKSWEDKRQKAIDDGEEGHPLIAYADFTDYVAIIIRSDNWEGVFSQFFKRKALVQESFQRLYPIRVCTMHARPITQDDELYLLVETKRLLKAMGLDLK